MPTHPRTPKTGRSTRRGLAVAGTVALTGTLLITQVDADSHATITVQGEDTSRTNIPTASDPDAAGGEYLNLDTSDDPPADGWHASYEIDVPAGIYRMRAIATAPVGNSDFALSVNGNPFEEVVQSHPYWGAYPAAWGDLQKLTIDDVELTGGRNTIEVRVDRRRIAGGPPIDTHYRFLLDEFSLMPVGLALKSVQVGDPDVNVDTFHGDAPEPVTFRLNGHAPERQVVEYTITDYFSADVASGTATIPAGDIEASAELPELPPGHYTVRAHRHDTPDVEVTGRFARLPDRAAVTGEANRFAVMSHPNLLPPARIDAFAAAMADMGAGYVRDEIAWPIVEPRRGEHDTSLFDQYTAGFADHGLQTLRFWGSSPGWQTPAWAASETSVLPADYRDAYRFAGRVARQRDEGRAPALELWNEPEQETFCCSTGDQLAAYTKAAALGIDDAPRPPLTALPSFFTEGPQQDLMLQGGVVPYADVWTFHSYPAQYPNPGGLTPFPPQSDIQHELRRLYDPEDATRTWATEAGLFSPADSGQDLTAAQQVDQARYLVQSTVQDLASGTDRHFWFIGNPCCAGELVPGLELYFGLLSRDFQPLASYSAHAAMASILGEANVAGEIDDLPEGVFGYVFNNGDEAVSVLWAESSTPVDVPVHGPTADVYDIMGTRTGTHTPADGTARVTAGLDPVYVVSSWPPGMPKPPGNDDDARPGRHSAAEHIVLGQRYDPDNAAPTKHVDEDPPFGYAMDQVTEMSVDVYNFNRTTQTVTVTGQVFSGWTIEPAGDTTVRVPARERVSIPFTITAGDDVIPGVDYPLVFDATLGGRTVPPSVSRIQLATGEPGEPLPLAPSITDIEPADGAAVVGPRVELTATITDDVSGVDPDTVRVEVDGRPVHSTFEPEAGRLSARLAMPPGRHDVWIAARNNAHAPAGTALTLNVTRR